MRVRGRVLRGRLRGCLRAPAPDEPPRADPRRGAPSHLERKCRRALLLDDLDVANAALLGAESEGEYGDYSEDYEPFTPDASFTDASPAAKLGSPRFFTLFEKCVTSEAFRANHTDRCDGITEEDGAAELRIKCKRPNFRARFAPQCPHDTVGGGAATDAPTEHCMPEVPEGAPKYLTLWEKCTSNWQFRRNNAARCEGVSEADGCAELARHCKRRRFKAEFAHQCPTPEQIAERAAERARREEADRASNEALREKHPELFHADGQDYDHAEQEHFQRFYDAEGPSPFDRLEERVEDVVEEHIDRHVEQERDVIERKVEETVEKKLDRQEIEFEEHIEDEVDAPEEEEGHRGDRFEEEEGFG